MVNIQFDVFHQYSANILYIFSKHLYDMTVIFSILNILFQHNPSWDEITPA